MREKKFDKEAERNAEAMLKILEEIKLQKCTECELGQIREIVGYDSFGSSIDYVYKKFDIPLVYVFEIYSDSHLEEPRFKSLELFKARKSHALMMSKGFTFIKNKSKFKFRELKVCSTPEECFVSFNPVTKEYYELSIEKWTEVSIKPLK